MFKKIKQYSIKNYNFRLIVYICLITIVGILVIGSARESLQHTQIVGFLGGLIIMVVVSLVDYGSIVKISGIFYLVSIGLLVAVLFAGSSSNNATRWLEIGSFRFQPSELCKILLILFFAFWFMKQQERVNRPAILAVSIALIAVPLLLIVKEPDLSTTIIVFGIFIAMLFVAGLSYKIIIPVVAVVVPIGIIFLALIRKGSDFLLQYQSTRILAWLDPDKYPQDAYQQQNAIMAIGSGQLFGKGLNNNAVDSVKNGNYISEPQTDFIFSVAGEELGFVGGIIIIILLLLVSIECILVARRAKDMAGRIICCGMAAWVGFQSFVNICVNTGLMPNTGLTLPFVSYGMTSLISLMIGAGFVLNVGLQAKNK